jgi:hypothetical protein
MPKEMAEIGSLIRAPGGFGLGGSPFGNEQGENHKEGENGDRGPVGRLLDRLPEFTPGATGGSCDGQQRQEAEGAFEMRHHSTSFRISAVKLSNTWLARWT